MTPERIEAAISSLEHLRATQLYLASMEEGLAELLSKVPTDTPDRRDFLSQPYVDEIVRLRAEIDTFLAIPSPKQVGAALKDAIRELAVYASPTPREVTSTILMNGYTSELVPRLTRVGKIKVSERVAELATLAGDP